MKQLIAIFSLVLLTLSPFAQANCDDLVINSVTLEPIDAGLLVVKLTNNNLEFGFSYPGFRIYDDNDNLIGEEVVNLFGIGEESTHLVPHNLNDIESGALYNLKLELWSGFYDTHECTFESAFEIMPEVCSDIALTVSLQTFNGTVETHDMQIIDQDGSVVFDQEITLTEDAGYVIETVCLDQGCYTYKFIPQDGISDNGFSCWINSVEWFFPEGYIQSSTDGPIAINFGIYSDCLFDSIEPDQALELLIYPNPAREIINVVGAPSGSSWSLLNVQGQEVRGGTESGRVEVDVEDLSGGMYFLKITTESSIHTYQIIR